MDTEEALKSLQGSALITEARWMAFDLVVTEILVALEACGIVTRREIGQALLRARARANLPEGDEHRDFVTETATSYIELLTESAASRLAAAPELWLLRREIEEWEQAGRRGRHPCEPTRRRAPSRAP